MEKNRNNLLGNKRIIIIGFLVFISLTLFTIKVVFGDERIETILEPSIEPMEVMSIFEYNLINDCANEYLNYIKDEDYQAVYSLLIKDYINENEITEENVLEKIGTINYENEFSAKTIYSIEAKIGISTYFVRGKIYNKDLKQSYDLDLIINVDYSNQTFEIAPLTGTYSNYIDCSNFDNIRVKDENMEEEINEIERTDYNEINVINGFGEKEIMRFYFDQYIKSLVYNPEEAYELLDKRYKEKRFGSYEEFEKYFKIQNDDGSYFNKFENLEQSILVKYEIKQCDGYKEYLCKDSFENYYIFRETDPMEYSVLLDQYTINDEIFLEKYNKQNDSEKAQMNLIKFQQMINREDYTAAYNVLDEAFREKYFKTEDDLIEYISNNFYANNSFEFTKITKENNVYKIETQVENTEKRYRDSFVKRFKLKMLNERDFSISFDI